jgi:hypothetical protein
MPGPKAFENLLNSVNQGARIGFTKVNKQINNPLVNMAVGQPFNLSDSTGAITINPGGSIVGNANNGFRFGIDAVNQNASIGKGMFDLSIGKGLFDPSFGMDTTGAWRNEPQVNLRFDTELNSPQSIQPVNMQQFLSQPQIVDPRDAAAQAEINAMRLPQAPYWRNQ